MISNEVGAGDQESISLVQEEPGQSIPEARGLRLIVSTIFIRTWANHPNQDAPLLPIGRRSENTASSPGTRVEVR